MHFVIHRDRQPTPASLEVYNAPVARRVFLNLVGD